jgi:hypothetical protein
MCGQIAALRGAQNPHAQNSHVWRLHSGFCAPCALRFIPPKHLSLASKLLFLVGDVCGIISFLNISAIIEGKYEVIKHFIGGFLCIVA